MPEGQSVILAIADEHPGLIRADAAYFDKRAKQCSQLAKTANDSAAAVMLRRLAAAFDEKARSLGSC